MTHTLRRLAFPATYLVVASNVAQHGESYAGRVAPSGAVSSWAASSVSPAPHAARDSLMLLLTNPMPHSMTLSYEEGTARRPLGDVDAGASKTVVLRDLAGDSVTVWATSLEYGHAFSHRFPTSARKQIEWELSGAE